MAGPGGVLSALLLAAAVLLLVPDGARSRRALRRKGAGSADAAQPPGRRPPGQGALRLTATTAAGIAVLLVVPGTVGAGLAVLVGGAVWWRSRVWESAGLRRHRALLEAELPHVVDLMTAALAAGAAPTAALSLVAEVVEPAMAEELRGWTTRLDLGTDPVAVWASMGRHPQLGRLGVTLHRSAESGAPVTAALVRLSEDLRARQRASVEERVRQVEVRAAVPLGVCLLPSFVLVGVVPLVAGSVSGLLVGR